MTLDHPVSEHDLVCHARFSRLSLPSRHEQIRVPRTSRALPFAYGSSEIRNVGRIVIFVVDAASSGRSDGGLLCRVKNGQAGDGLPSGQSLRLRGGHWSQPQPQCMDASRRENEALGVSAACQ